MNVTSKSTSINLELNWLAEEPGMPPQKLLELYEKALSTCNLRALSMLLEPLRNHYFIQQAKLSAQKILQHQPDSIAAISTLANIADFEGEYQESIYWHERILLDRPDHPSSLNAVIRDLLAQGRSAEALQKCLLMCNENSVPWHMQMAHIYLSIKEQASARKHLMAARQLEPGHRALSKALLKYYMASGEHEEARALAKRGLLMQPLDTQFTTYAIAVLAELGEYQAISSLMDYEHILRREDLTSHFSSTDLEVLADYALNHPSHVRSPQANSVRHGYRSGGLSDNEHELLARLTQSIRDSTRHYIEQLAAHDPGHPVLDTPRSRLGIEKTAVVLPKGGGIESHNHLDRWLSGVFYCTAPADETQGGIIEFGRNKAHWGLSNSPQIKKALPQSGELILFPSYLIHRVTAYSGIQPRVSIAFNVVAN